jgi:hypothetical protein
MPLASFPDLRFLEAHLPPTAGLTIRRGRGEVSLSLGAASEALWGTLQVAGKDLDLDYRGQTVAAAVTFDAALEGGDLQRGQLKLRDAELRLESTNRWSRETPSKAADGPWRGRLELSHARLQVIEPWHLKGDLEMQLTDSAPLFALFLSEHRLLKHFQRALTVRDVHGTTDLRLGRRRLALGNIELDGESLQLLGQLDLTEAPPDGLLWARFRGVTAALEIKSGKKELQVVRPRRWYDRRLEAWRLRSGNNSVDP